jgi:hypothetical protein
MCKHDDPPPEAWLTVDKLRAQLPKVGDQLLLKPHFHLEATFDQRAPLPCTVDLVSTEHLWFRVVFESGVRECFKLPLGAFDLGERTERSCRQNR